MSRVIKIGTTPNNNQSIYEVDKINIIAGKGIEDDRHYHDYNDSYSQLTLIESENIDQYNKKFNKAIPYLDFRRNIITRGIRLNDLINAKLKIGNIELLGIDLCRPCRHLQEKLSCDNIIKEFLRRGGLRCEILISGHISTGDKIEYKKNN